MQVFCENCEWSDDNGSCEAITNMSRIMPGEIMPHGWCVKCGGACHPKKEPADTAELAPLVHLNLLVSGGLGSNIHDSLERLVKGSQSYTNVNHERQNNWSEWFEQAVAIVEGVKTANPPAPAFDWSAVGPDLAFALSRIEAGIDHGGDGGPGDMKETLDLVYDTAQLALVNADLPDDFLKTVTLHHKDGATEEIAKGLSERHEQEHSEGLRKAIEGMTGESGRGINISQPDPLTRIAEALEKISVQQSPDAKASSMFSAFNEKFGRDIEDGDWRFYLCRLVDPIGWDAGIHDDIVYMNENVRSNSEIIYSNKELSTDHVRSLAWEAFRDDCASVIDNCEVVIDGPYFIIWDC